jgi:predicted nucleic acid-binding protein
MTVVDSSVWIGNLRGLNTRAVGALRALVAEADDEILVGDLILLKVLQGARNEDHARRIEQGLRAYPVARMLDANLAINAARSFRQLRAHGVTIRKTIDMIIGTFCIEGGHRLLHDDRDFEPMETYLGLRTVPL